MLEPSLRQVEAKQAAGQEDGPLRTWKNLPDEAWTDLAPRHHFESSAWLTAADLPGCEMLTALTPEGAVAVGLRRPDADCGEPPLHSAGDILCGPRAVSLLQRLGMAVDSAPVAAASQLSTVLSPFAYRTCLPGAADTTRAVAALREAIGRAAELGSNGVFIPYVREDETVLLEAVAALGGTASVIGAGCSVPVRQQDAEAHFRKGRRSARRAWSRYRARVEDGTLDARFLEAGEALDPRLLEQAVQLIAMAADRHGIRRPPLGLYRAVLGPWPLARTFQWTSSAHEMTGCALGLLERGRLVAKLGGHRDRDRGYLDVNLTGSVVLGHRLGVDEVDLGASTHGHKLERGAEVYWIYGALVGTVGEENQGLRTWLADYERHFVSFLTQSAATYDRSVPPLAASTLVGGGS